MTGDNTANSNERNGKTSANGAVRDILDSASGDYKTVRDAIQQRVAASAQFATRRAQ